MSMLHRCSAGRASFLGRRALCCRVPVIATIRAAALSIGAGDSSPTPTHSSEHPIHVTIVGGGAAGLTAAFFAAEHGARVTVLERTREAGKKILMSGGSRCNVLPLEVNLQTDFFSESSASAVRAVFASWNLELCKAWLEDPYWGVGLDLQLEEETMKYFPASNSSREVRDRLVGACLARGVVFKYDASVEGLQLLQPPQEAPQPLQPEASGPAAEPAPSSCLLPPPPVLDSAGMQLLRAAAAGTEGEELEDADGDAVARRRASGAAAGPADDNISSSGGGVDNGGGDGGGGGSRRRRKGRGPRSEAAGDATASAAGGATAVVRGGSCGGQDAGASRARWLCRLRDGTEHVTDKLIVATGGLSFPAVGTDGTGHRLLRALGHALHEPYPALTPLTGPHPAGEQLAGVSMYGIELAVQVPGTRRAKVSERTSMLFTHRGYSGPAVLDLSHYAVKALTRGLAATGADCGAGDGGPAGGSSGGGGSSNGRYSKMGLPSIRVNWTHEPAAVWDERIRVGGTALVTTLLQRHGLRERLAEALVSELGLVGRRVCDVKKVERAALLSTLTSYELPYHGHEGYKKAEVTGGGVRLEEVDCATMESRLLPNLYLCGEVLDVFGRIGGFNFYWAWVSGRLAGIGAAQGGLRPNRGNKGSSRARPRSDGAATAGEDGDAAASTVAAVATASAA